MFIKLDLESNEPIYTQLMHQIIAGIARNELQPGDRLPSVRSLASDIGINLHTVNKAYQQLKQDGFILIHRQRGVVVNPEGIPQADKVYGSQLRKTLKPYIAESVCRGMDQKEFLQICTELFSDFQDQGGEKK
ncbi:GntR family transcriptional regulator [Alkalihalobacillus sp. AL-G]|uniref:GntR family transcriptional regulator n=1 Tax=Alkalihalobacillus sp. AL-G TaxID=2926399 RepID=UPI00272B6F0B|nr:GntR family transcriptional regulator [Alkalihalobacillus sp. AL-G]WLD91706.1 GntR family transcriptional regulator [Alkalihalobacillus sp. AL-G]